MCASRMAITSAVAALHPDALAKARPCCTLCLTLVMRRLGFCCSSDFTYTSRSPFRFSELKGAGGHNIFRLGENRFDGRSFYFRQGSDGVPVFTQITQEARQRQSMFNFWEGATVLIIDMPHVHKLQYAFQYNGPVIDTCEILNVPFLITHYINVHPS